MGRTLERGGVFHPRHALRASAPAPRPSGCAFPYAAYSMPASWLHSHLHQFFVPAAALNSFLCTGLSCYSRCVLGLC